MDASDNPYASATDAAEDPGLAGSAVRRVRQIRRWMAAAGLGGLLVGGLGGAVLVALVLFDPTLADAETSTDQFAVLWVLGCGFTSMAAIGLPGLVAVGGVVVGGALDGPEQVERSLRVQLWVWRLLVGGASLVLLGMPALFVLAVIVLTLQEM